MGTIAPHKNSEVRLVLTGAKPLATIEKKKDPIGYALAISMAGTGALYYRARGTVDSPYGEVIITLPSNKHLVDEYITLLLWGVKRYGIKNFHRKMGRLFGYTEADIEAFIEADIDCDCSKCTGLKL
jgi:hypothetical protein